MGGDEELDLTSYLMESLPFSLPDEFPTPHNLSACSCGLNDRQAQGQYYKTLCDIHIALEDATGNSVGAAREFSANHPPYDEWSSIAVCIDAEMESVLGKMLGDAVGAAVCV
jgi:hypothetical protein